MYLQYVMQYVETPIEDAIEIIQSSTCADDKTICPDGTTCCKSNQGLYGCCPAPNAVCCKDGFHCCPHLSHCDEQHQTCVWSQFLPMLMGLPKFNDIDPPMENVSPFFIKLIKIFWRIPPSFLHFPLWE